MVSDFYTPATGFPFIQAFLGGFFLWLGINLRIQYVTAEDTIEE